MKYTKNKLQAKLVQILLTISIILGILPVNAVNADTKLEATPTLIQQPLHKKDQAVYRQGIIHSPRTTDTDYQVTTNLNSFSLTPDITAATIQIKPINHQVKAQTKWYLQAPLLALDLKRVTTELPAGIRMQLNAAKGLVTLTATHNLIITSQQNLQVNFPVRAVSGSYPFYLAMKYGHSSTTLATTPIGTMTLGGVMAHYQPQKQTRTLAKLLHPHKPQKVQAATTQKAAPAKKVKKELPQKPAIKPQKKHMAQKVSNHLLQANSGAAAYQQEQAQKELWRQFTTKPQLKPRQQPDLPATNLFNTPIAQQALNQQPILTNRSATGIKVHAENTQTQELVTKLNDDSISTQDVTPTFAAYFDGDGTTNPETTPAATVKVDAQGDGTLAVNKTGWYILHQTNHYPANTGWTYLIRNDDGTYTHGADANYYAVHYDATKDQLTQAMKGSARNLLPVYATDVTAYIKVAQAKWQNNSSIAPSWNEALSYLNSNGGALTFYGNGDFSQHLKDYHQQRAANGPIASYAYDYYSALNSIHDGDGTSSNSGLAWYDNQTINNSSYKYGIDGKQAYKYGNWLKYELAHTSGVSYQALPSSVDIVNHPLALSTTSSVLQTIGTKATTSSDTTVKLTNDLVTMGTRKMQRVNITTQDRLNSAPLESQYNVYYAGLDGTGTNNTAGVTLLTQQDTLNPLTGKRFLSNFNQDGWYVLQQKSVNADHQVNGSYYALKYSVLEGITAYYKVTQKYGEGLPLAPVLGDVTAYIKAAQAKWQNNSTLGPSWNEALSYLNSNGGALTFYGNGDFSQHLKDYHQQRAANGPIASYAYDYYSALNSIHDGDGTSSNSGLAWYDNQTINNSSYKYGIDGKQAYNYGSWLRYELAHMSGVSYQALPSSIDIVNQPLSLSTTGTNGAQNTLLTKASPQGTTQDGVITYTNDFSGQNEQQVVFKDLSVKLTKQSATDAQAKLTGAKFKVWYSGYQGQAQPLSADQLAMANVANQPLAVTTTTDQKGELLFNYNLEGWYVLQEVQAPKGYLVNGNYYAVYLSGAGITQFMKYSSNDAHNGPIAAKPENYTAGGQASSALTDLTYVADDPTAIKNYNNGASTQDGFLKVQAGQMTFSDRIGQDSFNTRDANSQQPLQDATFNIWDSGIDGGGVFDAQGNLKKLGTTTATDSNGQTIFTMMLARGWYIIQEQTPPAEHNRNAQYYAIYYDPANGVIGMMQYASPWLLPAIASDVTAYIKAAQAKWQNNSTLGPSWNDALNYLNSNGGALTFYGNGDFSQYLKDYHQQRATNGPIASYAYDYYSALNSIHDGDGTSSNSGLAWYDNQTINSSSYKYGIDGKQAYKYGNWLKYELANTSGVSYHALPKNIDIVNHPLAISTIKYLDLTPGSTNYQQGLTTRDGFITGKAGALTFNSRRVDFKKVARGDEDTLLAQATFNVWYSGIDGTYTPVAANQTDVGAHGTPQNTMGPTSKSAATMFDYSQAGWYIIQEAQAPEGYGVNGNYYAVYYDPAAGITQLMQYSSNDASKGPVAAIPSNYTSGGSAQDTLIDVSYIQDNPSAIAQWQKGTSTKDGFINIQAGQITFADRFNGINKIDADQPKTTLAGATFNIWNSGADGGGVLDSSGNLQKIGTTTATNKNGQTLLKMITSRGWYIIQEQDPPVGYNRNNYYYAIYYDPANGVIGMMKKGSRVLMPAMAPDVATYIKAAQAKWQNNSTLGPSWNESLSYLNSNGGALTFYGNGDFSQHLKDYHQQRAANGPIASYAYDYYSALNSIHDGDGTSSNSGLAWYDNQTINNSSYKYGIDGKQAYNYGSWLRYELAHMSGVSYQALPKNIDIVNHPLALSTKAQEYLDLDPSRPDYQKGLTTADGFLTGQNGALNFRDKFIGIRKVDQDDNQKTLAGATFKVFDAGLDGKSDPSGNPAVSQATNAQGITQMPVAGGNWYIIQEQDPPEGYSQNSSYYALKIDAEYGIVAMMDGHRASLTPVYDSQGHSNYGQLVNLAHETPAYKQPQVTTDGFLIAQAGHLVFQDKFTGLAKLDYYDETVPVADAQFHLWYAGEQGDQSPQVVDNQSKLPGESGYDASQAIFKTQSKGLLKLNMTKEGWYVLAEGQPAPGYLDHQNYYYAFHWAPGGGVDQFLKGHEQQLVQPLASDITAYIKAAQAKWQNNSTLGPSWNDALNYLNSNGGALTFYGNGDFSQYLKDYHQQRAANGPIASYAYDYYSALNSIHDGDGTSSNSGLAWYDNQTINNSSYKYGIDGKQAYKYGNWLKYELAHTSGVSYHALPSSVDLKNHPLALSTPPTNLVALPYAEKSDYNAPYRKGVTSYDGFVTAKNGALYMRNVPVTYLTLDQKNPLVVKRSQLNKLAWQGLWHDLYAQPNNQTTVQVGVSVDDQAEQPLTQATTASAVGTDQFGQHPFTVKFKDDASAPTALDGSHGTVGLVTNGADNSLGEHTLAFRAHGSVDSAIVKKKLIVVPDDYPYAAQLTKDFTVQGSAQHQTRAVLSDLRTGSGAQVTVYSTIKNPGEPLHDGQLTTTIPSQFQYLGPTQGTIDLTAADGTTVAAPVAFDGQTLTITMPEPLAKGSQYQLHYDLKQIAPMPLSYPGPSGGASTVDHLTAASHNRKYPFYGADSNLIQWFSDQALYIKLQHLPPLDFGTHLLIKDYKNAFIDNTATQKTPNENYLQLQDQGYAQQNTWQLTAQMSAWQKDGVASSTNLPGSAIRFFNQETFNQAGVAFDKEIRPGAGPITLLARSQGTLPSDDVTQLIQKVQLHLTPSVDPQAGSYHSTMTYTLTQSLD